MPSFHTAVPDTHTHNSDTNHNHHRLKNTAPQKQFHQKTVSHIEMSPASSQTDAKRMRTDHFGRVV
jgi:hypothetical protein